MNTFDNTIYSSVFIIGSRLFSMFLFTLNYYIIYLIINSNDVIENLELIKRHLSDRSLCRAEANRRRHK